MQCLCLICILCIVGFNAYVSLELLLCFKFFKICRVSKKKVIQQFKPNTRHFICCSLAAETWFYRFRFEIILAPLIERVTPQAEVCQVTFVQRTHTDARVRIGE